MRRYTDRVLRSSALWILKIYKSRIDDRKGFKCAFGALYGGETCSEAIEKLFQEKNFVSAVRETYAQLGRCERASEELNGARARTLYSTAANVFACIAIVTLAACSSEPCTVGQECVESGGCGL